MKQKKKLIISILTYIIIPIIIGLLVNFIYDKLKNHSNANKSGFDVEINVKINFN